MCKNIQYWYWLRLFWLLKNKSKRKSFIEEIYINLLSHYTLTFHLFVSPLLLQEMMLYHQTSQLPLPPGLYMGYLKLHVAVDLIRVLVSQTAPNVLPNVKVRDCSNISV